MPEKHVNWTTRMILLGVAAAGFVSSAVVKSWTDRAAARGHQEEEAYYNKSMIVRVDSPVRELIGREDEYNYDFYAITRSGQRVNLVGPGYTKKSDSRFGLLNGGLLFERDGQVFHNKDEIPHPVSGSYITIHFAQMNVGSGDVSYDKTTESAADGGFSVTPFGAVNRFELATAPQFDAQIPVDINIAQKAQTSSQAR